MEIDIASLKERVQLNCGISDAKHAGLFSLCGLLLRLRDMFKWENGVPPWEEPEPAELMQWVDEREELWETLLNQDFERVELGEQTFDPFDVSAINKLLQPFGLLYGAGYAVGMKPSFFLGELKESRQLGELRIDIVGRELVRDIFITPVMRQGNRVFARCSSMLFVIWDHILEMRPSVRDALVFALAQYGLDAQAVRQRPKEMGAELIQVAAAEIETWIYHEVGEYHEDAFYGQIWHEIVSTYSGSPIEIYARVVKDILADTHPQGLLVRIVDRKIKSSLGFYVANARAFTRLLFPEIIDAFSRFRESEDWKIVDEAREMGRSKASSCAQSLVNIHLLGLERGTAWARDKIMSELIQPLGIARGSANNEEDYRGV